ncbi:MAG: SpoIID/LytB domain-containing protein, partial [Ruminococcus sp.]|nr:SpoIID/LytB domain-containing protein [Ruminococcus sp.]
MKGTAKTLLILAFGIMLIPCLVFFKDKLQTNSVTLSDEVKILCEETGGITTLSRRDYLLYSTLSAISTDVSDETLKAQIVLQNTYLSHEQSLSLESLNGADLSDDETVYQKILTEDEASELIDNYDDVKERILSLIDEVSDEILTYKSSPIAVAYFESSYGQTESAKDIWGEDISYLQSVTCETDEDIEAKATTLSADKVKEALEAAYNITLSDDYSSWLEVTNTSKGGTPLKVKIDGEVEVLASELSSLLSLPSQHFELTTQDDEFTFVTKGVGHLVGMSQAYAETLALEGESYEEILLYFFDGCKLQTVK